MTRVYKVKITQQEFEVEADDEADADFEARELIDIDSIELIESDEE